MNRLIYTRSQLLLIFKEKSGNMAETCSDIFRIHRKNTSKSSRRAKSQTTDIIEKLAEVSLDSEVSKPHKVFSSSKTMHIKKLVLFMASVREN